MRIMSIQASWRTGFTQYTWQSLSTQEVYLIHWYTTEIPEPASSLSWHGAQIGVFGFPHNQNKSGSFLPNKWCVLAKQQWFVFAIFQGLLQHTDRQPNDTWTPQLSSLAKIITCASTKSYPEMKQRHWHNRVVNKDMITPRLIPTVCLDRKLAMILLTRLHQHLICLWTGIPSCKAKLTNKFRKRAPIKH